MWDSVLRENALQSDNLGIERIGLLEQLGLVRP